MEPRPSQTTARPDGRSPALPALEVDRRLDDWGASGAWRAVARRRGLEPLWRVWLRADVRGVRHVPEAGPALLAVHRSGPPWLALGLVAQALVEEHPRHREPVAAVAPAWSRLPAASVLLARLGAFPAVPANVERRLDLEGELVTALPEDDADGRGLARAGEVGSLRRDLLNAAVRAGAPVVPVVLDGLDRAAPALGFPRLPLAGRLPVRLPLVDPWLTPPLLPARVTVAFGPPILEPTGAGALDAVVARTREGLRELLRARPPRGGRWRR